MIKLTGRIRSPRLAGSINMVPAEGGGGPLQAKTAYPSHSEQIIAPDEDYYGLVAVTVKPVPRLPFAAVEVYEALPDVAETVVNLGAVVSVTAEKYVTFTSACYENTGGTELTGTIDVAAGDWVLATVTTRSATTLPSGWTVLKESTVLNAGASNQRMFFLCKQATADGTESITITQTDSARIYINLLAAKSAAGFAYHEGTEVYSDTEKPVSITVSRPDYKLLVWGCTANLWYNSAPYGEWTCSGLTAICLDQASTQPRQANFVDRTSAESRTFARGAADDGSYYIIDCVEVLY